MSWEPDTAGKSSTPERLNLITSTLRVNLRITNGENVGDASAGKNDSFMPDNADFNADTTSDNWNDGGNAAPAEGDGSGQGVRRCRKYDAQVLFNALFSGRLRRAFPSSCDQIGHIARDCPEPKKLTGECFNCGEVGHNKADCPNPKVARPFTGECRICKKEGHPAAECPDKPTDMCRICGQEGT